MYYFGGANDGSMKTGAQTVKDDNGDTYKFYFGTKNSTTETKGVGITGNKSNKLYYKGLLLTADDYKYQIATVEIDGKDYSFIVNANGAIQHSNVEYKEDGDVLIDTSAQKNEKGEVTDKGIGFETSKDNDLIKYSLKSYVDTDKNKTAHTYMKNYVEEINVKKVMH